MRLIDLDAFRVDYELRENCDECSRYGTKDCDYASYSARDFCGWLDDAPIATALSFAEDVYVSGTDRVVLTLPHQPTGNKAAVLAHLRRL